MKKILGAVAAVMLALVMLAPSASARCWVHAHRWHCIHPHHYWRYAAHPLPYYYYPYPYYASYPRPPYTYNEYSYQPLYSIICPYCY